MSLLTEIGLFKVLHALGIAGWVTIAMINNVQAFTVTLATVGRTMNMVLLQQDPPVNTPLLHRATASRAMHRAALIVIVVLQAVTAIAMWGGVALLLTGAVPYLDARLWIDVGILGFAACAFILLLGGLWYGYWIRQEILQMTHIAIVIWSIAAYLLFHLNMTV